MQVFILFALFAASQAAVFLNAPALLSTGGSTQYRAQDNIGNYNFGYDEGHLSGGTFRKEAGDAFGNKVGSYGLRDADGRVRVVNYIADAAGFRADIKTNEPGVEPKDPAATTINKALAVVQAAPAVAAYAAPAAVTTYAAAQAPVVATYAAPEAVTTYAAAPSPAVATYAAPAAVTTYSAAPAVNAYASPAAVTTYAAAHGHVPTYAAAPAHLATYAASPALSYAASPFVHHGLYNHAALGIPGVYGYHL